MLFRSHFVDLSNSLLSEGSSTLWTGRVLNPSWVRPLCGLVKFLTLVGSVHIVNFVKILTLVGSVYFRGLGSSTLWTYLVIYPCKVHPLCGLCLVTNPRRVRPLYGLSS